MSAINSLLHPTDFSEASQRAFDHALKIALCNKCSFDILHVHSSRLDRDEWSEFPQVRGTLEHWGLLEEGSPRSAVGDRLGVLVRKVDLGEKQPLTGIVHFVDEEEPELIVLSTQGRKGLPRWLHPSISEPLARRTRTATLFVPQDTRGFVSREDGDVDLQRVLIPVDRKPDPLIALTFTAALMRAIGAQSACLDVLFVGDASAAPEVEAPNETDGPFERVVRRGNPVDEILKFANERQSNLITMTTEGHHGFLDAIRGSTTEQVLRDAPCPVLAVPALDVVDASLLRLGSG
jgi:nucleotide-binding universal stress UspA family protein